MNQFVCKIFLLFSQSSGNNYSSYDDCSTQKFAGNVLFVEEDFAADDGNKTGGLFYKRHYCDFAGRVAVSDEESLVANYEHYGERPDPAVFNYTPAEADFFNQNIDYIIEDNEQHIPELKLRACYVFH